MSEQVTVVTYSLYPADIAVVEQHAIALGASRSTSLRHIIREWAASQMSTVRVPVIGKIVDGQVVLNNKE